MQKQRIQKLITFSPQLAQHIELRANALGVSFPEYIRSLAVADIKDSPANDYIIASSEMEEQIALSEKELAAGKAIQLDPENPVQMSNLLGDIIEA